MMWHSLAIEFLYFRLLGLDGSNPGRKFRIIQLTHPASTLPNLVTFLSPDTDFKVDHRFIDSRYHCTDIWNFLHFTSDFLTMCPTNFSFLIPPLSSVRCTHTTGSAWRDEMLTYHKKCVVKWDAHAPQEVHGGMRCTRTTGSAWWDETFILPIYLGAKGLNFLLSQCVQNYFSS